MTGWQFLRRNSRKSAPATLKKISQGPQLADNSKIFESTTPKTPCSRWPLIGSLSTRHGSSTKTTPLVWSVCQSLWIDEHGNTLCQWRIVPRPPGIAPGEMVATAGAHPRITTAIRGASMGTKWDLPREISNSSSWHVPLKFWHCLHRLLTGK